MTSIFAHRGYSGYYPENTMAAFRAAAQTGCAGIELDVQLSKDGEVVIIHDEKVDRTTNGSGFVKDFTLAQLQQLDARFKFGTDIPFVTIPSLRQYLSFVRRTRLFTNIEFKTGKIGYDGIEKKVIDLVHQYGLQNRVWYSSFHHDTLRRVKQILPTANVGLLVESLPAGIEEYAIRFGASSVNVYSAFLNQATVDNLHAYGLKAQAWTPNTEQEMTRLYQIGTDVLITNYPERGVQVVRNRQMNHLM